MKITKNITILKFVEKLQSLYQKGSYHIKELQHLIKIENAANITIDEIFGDNQCSDFIKNWNSECINTDYFVSQFTRLARNHVRTLITPITKQDIITIKQFVEKLVKPLYQEGREERTELEHLITLITEDTSKTTIKNILGNKFDNFIKKWKNKNVDTYKLVFEFTTSARNYIRTINKVEDNTNISDFVEKWVKPLYPKGSWNITELQHLIQTTTEDTSKITIKKIFAFETTIKKLFNENNDNERNNDFINNWKNKNVDTNTLVSAFIQFVRNYIRTTNKVDEKTNISDFVEKVQSLYLKGSDKIKELQHLIKIENASNITIQKIFGDEWNGFIKDWKNQNEGTNALVSKFTRFARDHIRTINNKTNTAKKDTNISEFVEKLVKPLYQEESDKIKTLQHLITIEDASQITIQQIFGDKDNKCDDFITNWNSNQDEDTNDLVSKFTTSARDHIRTLASNQVKTYTIQQFLEKVQQLYPEVSDEIKKLEHLITEDTSDITIDEILGNPCSEKCKKCEKCEKCKKCNDCINNWNRIDEYDYSIYDLVSEFTKYARDYIRTLKTNKITQGITILEFLEKWVKLLYPEESDKITELEHLITLITKDASNITIKDIFGGYEYNYERDDFIENWNSKYRDTNDLVSQFTKIARNHVRKLTTNQIARTPNTIQEFLEKNVQPLYPIGSYRIKELKHLITLIPEDSHITIYEIFGNEFKKYNDFIEKWNDSDKDINDLVSEFTLIARDHIRTLTANQIAATYTIQQFLEKVKLLYPEGSYRIKKLKHLITLITQDVFNITIRNILDCDQYDAFIRDWNYNNKTHTEYLVSKFIACAKRYSKS